MKSSPNIDLEANGTTYCFCLYVQCIVTKCRETVEVLFVKSTVEDL